ncbi:UNVERIFIED_CONTAM: hypothetical protein LK11_04620 [Mumia flava]
MSRRVDRVIRQAIHAQTGSGPNAHPRTTRTNPRTKPAPRSEISMTGTSQSEAANVAVHPTAISGRVQRPWTVSTSSRLPVTDRIRTISTAGVASSGTRKVRKDRPATKIAVIISPRTKGGITTASANNASSATVAAGARVVPGPTTQPPSSNPWRTPPASATG